MKRKSRRRAGTEPASKVTHPGARETKTHPYVFSRSKPALSQQQREHFKANNKSGMGCTEPAHTSQFSPTDQNLLGIHHLCMTWLDTAHPRDTAPFGHCWHSLVAGLVKGCFQGDVSQGSSSLFRDSRYMLQTAGPAHKK